MDKTNIRDKLHEQIDKLPDEVVDQIADFTMFILARRRITSNYADWDDHQWQTLALEQFFREDDEVEYSLNDAKEIYRP